MVPGLTRTCITCLITAASTSFAGEREPSTLSLDLTRDGFAAVSDVAKEKFLNQLQDAPLPDQEISVPLTARTKLQGVTFSVALESLLVEPAQDGLKIHAVIDNIHVDIRESRFENWFVPALGTSCYNTAIDLGNHESLPLHAQVDAVLVGGDLRLNLNSFNFSVDQSQYQAQGPDSCYGLFEIRDFVAQFVLSKAIENARPLIALGIRHELKSLLPKVGAMLKDFAARPMTVTTPNLLVVPATKVVVSGGLEDLMLTPDHGKFKLAVKIDPAIEEDFVPRSHSTIRGEPVVYGTLGVTSSLVNDALAAVLVNGTNPIELTPDADPFVQALTNREALALLWPDLDLNPTNGETLRLFARLGRAPTVSVKDDLSPWHIFVPDVELRYMLNRNGQWIDYATMHIQIDLDLEPRINGGALTLKIVGGTPVASAAWAPTYQPADPTFNSAKANETFQLAINFLATTDNPLAFGLPSFSVAGRALAADHLRIDESAIKLDIVAGSQR